MLEQFTVGNYRSFDAPMTLSMATPTIEAPDTPSVPQSGSDTPLLLTKGLYGPNASGKTNLMKAMQFMADFVTQSSKNSQADEPIAVQAFRLRHGAAIQPSLFEASFVWEGMRYRYGFAVTRHRVHEEWLFVRDPPAETLLFTRHQQDITVGPAFTEGHRLASKTRDNALFLSVVAQFNGPIARQILQWFSRLKVIAPIDHQTLMATVPALIARDEGRLLKALTTAHLGIEGIGIQTGGSLEARVYTEHPIVDRDQRASDTARFDLLSDESEGTQTWVALMGSVLRALDAGSILALDTPDAGLHPRLFAWLIQPFGSPDANPKRAQLIFTTHHLNPLIGPILPRGQLDVVEKDRYGASHLFPRDIASQSGYA